MSTKPSPRKFVQDTESYDRLELLCYGLHKVRLITEQVRDESLFQLDTWFGYVRGCSDFAELEEFYYRMYEELPAPIDNEFYTVMHEVSDDPSESEVEYFGAIDKAVRTALDIGNVDLAHELARFAHNLRF